MEARTGSARPANADDRFRGVEDYFLARRREQGDVYGWGVATVGARPTAQLIVDPTADLASFPIEIQGVRIALILLPKPEAL